jgi:RecA-family ATPase
MTDQFERDNVWENDVPPEPAISVARVAQQATQQARSTMQDASNSIEALTKESDSDAIKLAIETLAAARPDGGGVDMTTPLMSRIREKTGQPRETLAAILRDAVARLPAPEQAAEQNIAPNPWKRPESKHKLLWYKDIEPVLDDESLIGGLLGSTGISMIVGASGSTKTFFALEMGLCIASGLDFFGRSVKQGGVVYIAAEAGESIRNRVYAWRLAHPEVPLDIPFAAITWPVDFYGKLAPNSLADVSGLIERAVKDGTPIAQIIVDTMSRATPGADENSAQDMTTFLNNMDLLHGFTGAPVGLVHHHGKAEDRGARGHSSLYAAVDTEITVKYDKVTGIATAEVTKQRDLPTEGKIAYKLRVVEVGRLDDGTPVTSCVIEAVEGAAVAGKSAKPVRLPDSAKAGLDQLRNCIAIQSGPVPVSAHVPSGVSGVTEEQWKAYLKMSGVISPDSSNPRQDFKRIKDKLLAAECIGSWGEWVWITDRRASRGVANRKSAQNAQKDLGF